MDISNEDSRFKDGYRRMVRSLEQLRFENPEAHKKEVRLRQLDYWIATRLEDMTISEQENTLSEWRKLRSIP